jgi:hypothetical protein
VRRAIVISSSEPDSVDGSRSTDRPGPTYLAAAGRSSSVVSPSSATEG